MKANGVAMRASGPQTLPTLVRKALQKYAERTALISEGEYYSYSTLDAKSSALAAAFQDNGVTPGDRIAVFLSNRPEYPVVDLAIMKSGAARLPINPMLSPPEIQHILEDSGASTIICDADCADKLEEVSPVLSLQNVIFIQSEGSYPAVPNAEVQQYEQVLATAETNSAHPLDVDVKPDDVAGHFYTGGTTGKPRGVIYSQEGLTKSLYAHLAEFGFNGADTGLVVTPLSHSAGTFLWANLIGGATTVIQKAFEPEQMCRAIDEHDVTWTFVVPTMLYRLLDAQTAEYNLSTLDRLLYGAAPIRSARLKEAVEMFGQVLTQFYGQTEVPNLISSLGRTEHVSAARESSSERLQSAGQPCLQAEVRIVDPETGNPCPEGKPGEILVSAPYAFERYHNRPAETAETLQEGWVHTGDIGRIDKDGYLYLLDRKHGVIVSGGMNVYSTTVEDVLGEHQQVRDIAVFGVPHEDWGEAVHAVVVSKTDSLTEEDIQTYAASHLADYEKPKSITFTDSLPTTEHGKVDKETLRKPFWEGHERSVN